MPPPVRPPTSHHSEAELADALDQAIFGSDPAKLPARSRARRRGIGSERFERQAFERALNGALERAAVTGRFLPAEIVPDAEKPLAEAVLSQVAPNCDTEKHDTHHVWLLGRDLRRDTLAHLWHEEDKSRVVSLMKQIPAHRWDDAGRYLQSILQEGKPLNPPSSLTAMRALAQAYDWVSEIVDVKTADSALRQSIAFRSLIEDSDKLLKKGFFGRRNETAQLERFLRANYDDLARNPPVLTITGVGGSGKSTFLAAVCRDLLARRGQGAPAVFSIDFDRFGLGPNSLIELTFEITRQIALYYPGVADEFAKLRAELRQDLASATGSDTRNPQRHAVSIRFLPDLLRRICRVISPLGWRNRDAILVLDTFEELQAKRVNPDSAGSSGAYATDQIASWIRALVVDVQLERLRVVVSGRASVDPESQLAAFVVDSIDLQDLDPPDAVMLLTSSGLSPHAAEQLQPIVGGNPLLLRIAARLVRKLPPKKRSAILQELASERVGLDTELVQGVLYDRILQHIRDSKVRKLAHPGLVLRRVTWRLIRDVLAEPCDLDPSTKLRQNGFSKRSRTRSGSSSVIRKRVRTY